VVDAPNVKAARANSSRSLTLTWKGGAESVIDLSSYLAEYRIFVPLRQDEDLFRKVQVGEWGWCIRWSEDMEISSDTLWRLGLDQGSSWLRAWRVGKGMTQAEAAKALGVSPRMWRYYEAGVHLLPKTVRLAVVGFDTLDAA
jgi:hypothetical protein